MPTNFEDERSSGSLCRSESGGGGSSGSLNGGGKANNRGGNNRAHPENGSTMGSSRSQDPSLSLDDRLKILYPMVNEEETPLPRCWSFKDKFNFIGLSHNNLRVQYKGNGKTHKEASSVRATHSIPASCGIYYFEVRLELLPPTPLLLFPTPHGAFNSMLPFSNHLFILPLNVDRPDSHSKSIPAVHTQTLWVWGEGKWCW